MEAVVKVEGLVKRYGSLTAVDDVSFEVRRGEIFALIGPNGAGKTSVVESLIGLRARDGGRIDVLGADPATAGPAHRGRIGAQLQAARLQDRLRVEEALRLFASLYDHPDNPERLLEEWGLGDKRKTAFADLSGGQRQRLFIALALINRPELVILDELTTGLDPQARRATWDLVRAIRSRGATVVLVTHFMEEAELLADRIGVMAEGKLRALDTPARLLSRFAGQARVRFTCPSGFDASLLASAPGVETIERENGTVVVTGQGPLLVRVAARLDVLPNPPHDFRADRSTLEDVFLALTGTEVRD